MKSAVKKAPAKSPVPFERSLEVIAAQIEEVAKQQQTVLASTLIEVLQYQKRILDRLGDLMSSVDDLNQAETRLAQDTATQQADIDTLTKEQSMQIVAVQQQIASLKQQQPALDLTSLNASITSLEANHQKLIDLANVITAAMPPDPAGAPTTPPAQSPADPGSTGANVTLNPPSDPANPSHS